MKRLIPLLTLVIWISACEKTAFPSVVPTETPSEISSLEEASAAFSPSQRAFAFDLFKQVNDTDRQSANLILSPFSVTTALLMAYNGAEASTQSAMAETLGWTGQQLSDLNESYRHIHQHFTTMEAVELQLANGVFWDQQRLSPKNAFQQRMQDFFAAEASSHDFLDPLTKDHINGWVADKTQHKIKALLAEIDPREILFLINTLYLRAKWTEPFAAEATYSGDFFPQNDQSPVQVRYMYKMGVVRLFEDDQFSLIDLPFGENEDLSLCVILPKADHTLESVLAELDESRFSGILLQSLEERSVQLHLPKFDQEYKTPLNEVLSTLGMSIAFSNQADFSGIDDRPLAIRKVLHHTNFTLNEYGVEAAGATSISIFPTSAPPELKIDRPFLFVLSEHATGAILFMGKITLPKID